MNTNFSLFTIPSQLFSLLFGALLFVVASCSGGMDFSDANAFDSRTDLPAIVKDARKALMQQDSLCKLRMWGRFAPTAKRGKQKKSTISLSDVNWKKYHLFMDRDEECAAIPIEEGNHTVFSVLNVKGDVKKTRNKVMTKLLVRREASGRLTLLLGTYVYDMNYAREYAHEIPKLGYLFDDTHFTGYFMTSWLQNGKLILGRCMQDGRERFSFRANPNPAAKRGDNEGNQKTHLYIGFDD